jgi:paraquat-inducible protein B
VEAHQELLNEAIAHGLKAQLRTANLLTGQRFVALDFMNANGAPAPSSIRLAVPFGEIPTVSGGIEDLQLALTDMAKKIDKVPFGEIAQDLRDTMAVLQRTLNDTDAVMQQVHGEIAPELTQALSAAKQAMSGAQKLLAQDAPAQQDLREALRQLARTAESLRELTDMLQRHPEALLRGRPSDLDKASP